MSHVLSKSSHERWIRLAVPSIGVEVSKTFHVSERKVYVIRKCSETQGGLVHRAGEGRGVSQSAREGRCLFSSEGKEGIRAINVEREAG